MRSIVFLLCLGVFLPASAQNTRDFPYHALVSCGMHGSHINVLACFSGRHVGTEMELRNGDQYGLYKVYEISKLGTETRDGLRIELRRNFALKVQNSSDSLVLTVTIVESATNKRVFQKSAAKFGVVSVAN